MKDFVNVVITTIIVLVGFIFLPIYYSTQIETAKSYEVILNETQLFLDRVADTHKITEEDLEDFTLAINSTTVPMEFEIYREARQINPDPTSTEIPRNTYTTWVPHENIYDYDEGDIVTVKLYQVGKTSGQQLSSKFFGMFTPEIDLTLSRMVR